jgi:hypothetical protein
MSCNQEFQNALECTRIVREEIAVVNNSNEVTNLVPSYTTSRLPSPAATVTPRHLRIRQWVNAAPPTALVSLERYCFTRDVLSASVAPLASVGRLNVSTALHSPATEPTTPRRSTTSFIVFSSNEQWGKDVHKSRLARPADMRCDAKKIALTQFLHTRRSIRYRSGAYRAYQLSSSNTSTSSRYIVGHYPPDVPRSAEVGHSNGHAIVTTSSQ